MQKFSRQIKFRHLFIGGLIFLISAFALSVFSGSVKLTPNELLFGRGKQIFLYVRLPRTIACLVSGAALAVAGCITQTVLHNKLASPSIIGVNSGAGLAVTICSALGIFGWLNSIFAFIGAFLTVMIITFGADKLKSSKSTLILFGVGTNSVLSAISSAIVTIIPDAGVISNDFKIGDFSGITYEKIIPASIITVAALIAAFTMSTVLDVIKLGDEGAQGIGLNIKRFRPVLLIIAALLAGSAVSIAGLLSFVGLIVPHMVRMMGIRSTGHVLPLSSILGGGFVIVSDLLARVLFSPYEIPVGIIMSFIGAPFFIFLLFKRGDEYDKA